MNDRSADARTTTAEPDEILGLTRLSLGSWHTFDRIRFAEGVQLVEAAFEAGIRHFDVGVYDHTTPSFTDVIFAALVRAAGLPRDEFRLSFKLWLSSYPDVTLRAQLESALLRTGEERVEFVVLGDLPGDRDLDLARIVDELGALGDEGLIGRWNVNNWPAAELGRTLDIAERIGVAPPAFAQLKYSVARRSVADGEPFAEIFARGVRLEASDVLEGGILAGRAQPDRQIGKDPGGVRERILADLPSYLETVAGLGISPAEFAIAFAASHPSVATTLFGASRIEQVSAAVRGLAFLDEVGSEVVRAAADPHWADRGLVDPAS